jgi:hypothetical protein
MIEIVREVNLNEVIRDYVESNGSNLCGGKKVLYSYFFIDIFDKKLVVMRFHVREESEEDNDEKES